MKLLKQSKGLTAALSMGCAMSIAVQSSLAYIFTQTEPAHNIFQPYTPVEGDLLITKKVYHPYGDSYTIPDNIAFDFQVDLGGFYANYTFTTSKGLIKADENGILSLKVKPDESVAISGIEDGTTAEITEIQQDSDGFELDGNEIRSVKVSAEKLNEIEFVNVYSPEPAAADITVTAEKLLDGRDWQEGDSFELLFERGSPDEWIKLDSAVVEYGGENKVDFTEAMKAMEFSALGDYVFRLTETEGDIENIIYDDTENTFTVSVTDNDMDGYLEISKISAENNAVLTTGDDGTYDINVTFTNIYEPPVTTETTTKPTTTTSTSTVTTTKPTTTTSTSTITTTKPTTTSTSTVSTTKPTTTTSTYTITTTEPTATTSTSTVTTTEPTTTTSTSTITTTKPTTTSTSTVTTTEPTTTTSTTTTKPTTTSTTTTKPTTTVADGAVTWDIEDKNIPYSDNDQTVTVAVVITNGEKPLPIAGGKFTIVTTDGLILEAVTGSDAYGGDIFGDGIYDEFAFTSADGKGIAPADGTLAFELLVTIPGGTDPGRYNIDIGSCEIYDENGNDITDKLTIVGGSITILPRVTSTTEPTTTTSTSTVTTTEPTTTTSTSIVTTTEPTTSTSTSTVSTTKPTTTSTSTVSTTKPTTSTSTSTITTTEPTTTSTSTITTTKPTTTSTSTVSTTKPTTSTSTSTVTTTKPTTTTSTSTVTTTEPTTTTSTSTVTTTKPTTTTSTSTVTTTKPTTTVADGAVTWDIEDKNIPYSESSQTVTVAVVITNGEKPLPIAGGKFTIVTADGLVLESVTGSDAYGGDIFGDEIYDEFAFTSADGKGIAPADGTLAFELLVTIPGGTDPGRYNIDIGSCEIYDENGNDITDKLTIVGGSITILPRVTTTTEPTTTTSTVTTTEPTTTSTSTVTTTKPTTTISTSTVFTTKPTSTSTSTVSTTKPTTTTSTVTTTEPTTTIIGAVTWDIEDKNVPYSDKDQTVTVAVIIKNGEAPLPIAGGKFTIVTADGLVLEAVTSSTGYGGTVTENDSGEFTFTTDDGLNVSPENGDIAFELIITVPGGTEPGEYDISIDECQIFDEDGSDITNRVAVMNGAIIILPTVEPTINSYIVIEKPELGNYFSHDNRTYDKSKLGKVYRVYVDENGEEIDREDVTDDIDFNGNTPADTYRESNTSFRYEVPIYLEGELMMDENGEISTAVAYIGVKGDVNLDNHANAIDATLILAYYAKMQTGESSETTILCHDDPYLDNLGAFLGDVDTNEYSPMNQATHKSVRKLDASDTSFILSYYAVTQTSYDPVPREIWKQVVGVDNIIDE